jgi:hypothetical protein
MHPEDQRSGQVYILRDGPAQGEEQTRHREPVQTE